VNALKGTIGCGISLVICASLGTGAWAQEPVVLTARFSTADAPEATPTDHGPTGQNAWIEWHLVGPGPTEGSDAVYVFPSIMREEGAAGPPRMALLDLATGKFLEIYPTDRIQVTRAEDAREDEPGGVGEAEPQVVNWYWGTVLSAARSPDGRVFLGMDAGGKGSSAHAIVAYDPRKSCFREIVRVPSPPTGLAFVKDTLHVLSADGTVRVLDEIAGLEAIGRVSKENVQASWLVPDGEKWFYTRLGPAPYRVFAVRVEHGKLACSPLLPGLTCERVSFHENVPGPWCEIVVRRDGRFSTQRYALRGGQATPLDEPPDESALAQQRGYELRTDWDVRPLEIAVRKPGQEWKRHRVTFRAAAWDRIKSLSLGPEGKCVYGAGWPTAWIWRFDPQTARFRMLGRDYVWYEMHPWKDELWVVGYWGIKLMRWRPEEPWTFDYDRHYARKRYPGSTSPWGDKEASNPRLVCKFRYLKQLEVRRPAGLVITDQGHAYTGGHTPAVEYFSSRYGGAVSWYDPETETIGQIREPFLHHSVRDMCRAGPHHVAAAASQYIGPFDPLPEDFSPGRFVVIDTRTRQVALDCSPLDAPLSYCEEGVPGRVVVAGSPGKYSGEGVRGALFIFDVQAMRATHIVRLPVSVRWAEYDNAVRFERGPDQRVYFYGRDDKGVALCRVDSRTGKVEPVLRGRHLTDVQTYNNPGACFAFCGDRVYFGAQHLVSLPANVVTGGTEAKGSTP